MKSEKILCEGCGHKIQDRYLMKVGDGSWHELCLACSICGTLLSRSCYSRNNKLYCKTDYDRFVQIRNFFFRFFVKFVNSATLKIAGYSARNVPGAEEPSRRRRWWWEPKITFTICPVSCVSCVANRCRKANSSSYEGANFSVDPITKMRCCLCNNLRHQVIWN